MLEVRRSPRDHTPWMGRRVGCRNRNRFFSPTVAVRRVDAAVKKRRRGGASARVMQKLVSWTMRLAAALPPAGDVTCRVPVCAPPLPVALTEMTHWAPGGRDWQVLAAIPKARGLLATMVAVMAPLSLVPVLVRVKFVFVGQPTTM